MRLGRFLYGLSGDQRITVCVQALDFSVFCEKAKVSKLRQRHFECMHNWEVVSSFVYEDVIIVIVVLMRWRTNFNLETLNLIHLANEQNEDETIKLNDSSE